MIARHFTRRSDINHIMCILLHCNETITRKIWSAHRSKFAIWIMLLTDNTCFCFKIIYFILYFFILLVGSIPTTPWHTSRYVNKASLFLTITIIDKFTECNIFKSVSLLCRLAQDRFQSSKPHKTYSFQEIIDVFAPLYDSCITVRALDPKIIGGLHLNRWKIKREFYLN